MTAENASELIVAASAAIGVVLSFVTIIVLVKTKKAAEKQALAAEKLTEATE